MTLFIRKERGEPLGQSITSAKVKDINTEKRHLYSIIGYDIPVISVF